MNLIWIAIASGCTLAALQFWRRNGALKREAYIQHARLPQGLFAAVVKKYPHLTPKDCELVAQGLRQFFTTYLKSGRRFVAMPSQAVDEMWHEFILHTKSYELFCQKAFGRFLHHSPAVILTSNRQKNTGLRRCWWFACREENINPNKPSRLPLLFALDAKLQIADGFRYVPDCQGVRREGGAAGGCGSYCGGDFSNASFDGGTDGFSDGGSADGGASDGGGSDGGCGGGGCGGGGD